jgi:hypothetical protein
MVVLAKGATCGRWGGMGGCDWAKCFYFTNTKLKMHVKQLRSMTFLKICKSNRHWPNMWENLGWIDTLEIAFDCVKLFHSHRKWWACEPTITTSTYIGLLIQAYFFSMAPNQFVKNLPMMKHFPTNMPTCASMWFANITKFK